MKVLAVVAALAVLVVVLDQGDDSGGSDSEGGELTAALAEAESALLEADLPLVGADPEAAEDVPGPSFPIARVEEGERVELHDAPDGNLVAEVGDETEFGSVRSFRIVKAREGWLGVTAPELPNGSLAWIRNDPLTVGLYETNFWVVADVSERQLELRYGKRVLDSFPVTVGSSGSPTPLGTYAVTDGLVGPGVGPYYGCCVLALSGHQPNLPQDWIGGDRIAIHGTPGSIGGASSAGCLRASDPDMVSLFARVPLGAPVFIRA